MWPTNPRLYIPVKILNVREKHLRIYVLRENYNWQISKQNASKLSFYDDNFAIHLQLPSILIYPLHMDKTPQQQISLIASKQKDKSWSL
jgi:hypothetical protein